MLWLLFLLALACGPWLLISPSPRIAWQADKQTHIVGFALNGKVLATTQGWWAGPICLWDVDSGTLRFTLAHDWPDIKKIELSPDGRYLAARNDREHLIVWDIATGEERLNRELDNWFGFRFSPDSKRVIFQSGGAIRGTEPYVHFWNIDSKCEAASVPGWISHTAVAQDGKSFAQWHGDHWDPKKSVGACVQFWKLGEQPGAVTLDRQLAMPFYDITFSTDLNIFVTVSRQSLSGEGAEIAVWDSVTGQKKAATAWQHPEMHLQFMYFSPDDRFLIADIRGDGWKLVKWDVHHGIKMVPTHAEWQFRHESPDGKFFLIVKPDGADLLDARTHAKRGTLHKEGDRLPPFSKWNELPQFAFSADSRMVIATGLEVEPEEPSIFDKLAERFGLSSPQLPFPFQGDPVARLYDTDTASEMMAFQNCSQAQFSPEGRLLATVHDDGTIRIWDAPPKKSFKLLIGLVSMWLAVVIGTCLSTRRLAASSENREPPSESS